MSAADIVEKLRATKVVATGFDMKKGRFEERTLINPDGPEAATEIEALRAREVVQIARGLTRAQRKAVIAAQFDVTSGRWRCPNVMHPADKNMRAKGLSNGPWVELTALGLAVKMHLQGRAA